MLGKKCSYIATNSIRDYSCVIVYSTIYYIHVMQVRLYASDKRSPKDVTDKELLSATMKSFLNQVVHSNHNYHI